MQTPDLFMLSICYFFAWLFLFAGSHKLRNADYYNDIIKQYVPIELAPSALAMCRCLLASVELLVAFLLLVPASQAFALVLTIGLLLFYTASMLRLILLGKKDIDCGCAGPAAGTTISPRLLLRNTLLASLAALVLFLPIQVVEKNSLSVVLVAFMSIFMVLLYMCFEQLISNQQKLVNLK